MIKALPCRDCKKVPVLNPEWIGYSLHCECYDPTPYYSDGPPMQDHMEMGKTKEEVIEYWNENWGIVWVPGSLCNLSDVFPHGAAE